MAEGFTDPVFPVVLGPARNLRGAAGSDLVTLAVPPSTDNGSVTTNVDNTSSYTKYN